MQSQALQIQKPGDLWNNEIVSHTFSAGRGDRMTYISGPEDLIALKKLLPDHQMILHSDQDSVYSSKSFNALMPMYGDPTLCVPRWNTDGQCCNGGHKRLD